MVVCIVQPISLLRFPDLKDLELPYFQDASAASAQGEIIARTTLESIISERTEAYILDRAAELDMSVQVQVVLGDGDEPVPEAVVITGQWMPLQREKLERIIEDELSITKEYQTWNGIDCPEN